jgi:DNA polymerase-3 subunit gamma/tau
MSYEVLARKWRPLTFDDVVGQDHITNTLKKAVETGRISHAYLLAGPRGCGKTSTARILARVINCENRASDGNPCNECASCQAVIRGNNLDVMEIDGASHTGVGEVRDLQESIGYAPSQHRGKVYIIDEVHMLSTHAFNALLKTLEEPPRHVFFVFATTAPQKIPDTIKSRCQRHHFKRLEIKEIAGQLRTICEAEGVTFDEDALRLLARKADGSMRDGTSLLDQCITSSDGNLTTDAVRDILGLIGQETVFAFMRTIANGDATAALKQLSECVDEGLDIQELCVALLEGFRDLMLLAAPGDLSDLLLRSKDEIELMRELLAGYELPDLVTIVERLCDATPRLKTAADPRILLESMLVDLALLDRQVDIRRLIADLPNEAGGLNGEGNRAPARPAKRKATPGQPPPPGGDKNTGGNSVAGDNKGGSRAQPGGSSGSATAMPSELGAASFPTEGARDSGGTAAGRAPVAPDETPLDTNKLMEMWDGFVTFVRQKKLRLGVCLFSGKIHSFDGSTIALRFAKSFGVQNEQVAKPENIQFLKKMMAKYFGREMDIVCFREGEEQDVKLSQRAKKADLTNDGLRGVAEEKKPVVKKLLDEFDGEIIRYNPR